MNDASPATESTDTLELALTEPIDISALIASY